MQQRIRMRSAVVAVVLASTLIAGAGVAGSASSSPATTVRQDAIAWLTPKVTPEGALISSYTNAPDPSLTAQAALGLAGAGADPAVVHRMTGWLEGHVAAFVAPGGSVDSPGALSWLILVARATGVDPTEFGGVDLVSRLLATQRPDGLFGAGDATYDGAFRQGLSLVALSAVGRSNPTGVAWLVGQQCADGGYVALRTDTSVPCPAVDPSTFTGEDTNSTAMAAMALHLAGDVTATGRATDWLASVRTPGGGFAYLGDSALEQDANSTGLVSLALRTVSGTQDAGSVAALASLQVSQTGDPSDRGGIAFQTGDPLFPDLMATTQALLGLAGQGLPFVPIEVPNTSLPGTSVPGTSVPRVVSSGEPTAIAAIPVPGRPAYTG